MQQTYKFYVSGLHCNACVLLIEDKLKDYVGVSSIKADLQQREVLVSGEFNVEVNKLAQDLTELIKKDGYTLSVEKPNHDRQWREFYYALPLATMLIIGFLFLQKMGLVNLIGGNNVNYSTALIIGLIASVSTCLAVVGGLVLSLSANYAKSGQALRPQMMFHLGRLFTFFILGGVIGAIGSALHLNLTSNLIVSILVALVMLILGINLLDIFHHTKKWQVAMPSAISKHTLKYEATNFFGPFLIGALTFFLPCGFTQSMQIYTLSTGSFFTGGLTMLVFALGTLPVLAILSFSSFSINHKPWRGTFFKTAGLVVIALAVFNLINALVVAGWLDPVFNF